MSGPPAVVKKPGAKKPGGLVLAGPRDPAAQALLEYQSPTSAVIERPVPLPSRHTNRVVAAMFASLLAILALVPVDRVVATAGKVSATAGNLTVEPLGSPDTPSVLVRSISVKEGQLVHAGDVLAELDPTFAQADAGSLESQVSSLQAEVDRLTAETHHRPYVSDGSAPSQLQAMIYAQRHAERSFKTENYAQQIKGVEVKIAQARSDVASLTERRKLATEMEDKRRELERLRVGSQLNRLQATDSRVDIEAQLAAAKSQMTSSQRELDALVAERDDDAQQWLADTSKQLTDQDRLLADARQQLSKATLLRQLVQLRAPRDAIVLRVAPVNVGTVMQSGQEFIEMVPLDTPLQIESVVDGSDVGFVRIGDPVTIKFETFPDALYGTAMGTVRAMSPDSFQAQADQQTAQQAAQKTATEAALGVLSYRARVSIDELHLHDLPAGARIVPGMPVQADIHIGKRTVLRYLLSRLIPAGSEAMREP